MLRISGSRRSKILAYRSVNNLRRLSVSSVARLAELPIPKPPTTPILKEDIKTNTGKKRTSFIGILFRTLLVGTVAYGGTLYVATKNDKVMDFVIDNQLPYHEEIFDFFEHTTTDDVKNKFNDLKEYASNFSLPTKDQMKDLGQKLEDKGESFISETKKRLSPSERQKAIEDSHPLPEEQLQKPVEVESVRKDISKLRLISVDSSKTDPSIQRAIDLLNELTQSVPENPANEKLVKAIQSSVTELSEKLNGLSQRFDDEVASKLKVSQTELLSSYTQKELELTENLIAQFNREKSQLDKKYDARLQQEIDATKQALSQAAVNAISMVRLEQTKNFEALVKNKIDSEREGRLANLNKLDSKVSDLEKFSTSLESQISSNNQRLKIQRALENFKNAFGREGPELKSLSPYLDHLTEVSNETKDELLAVALADLRPLIVGENSKSILSTAQLLSRWEQLTPELRSSSLLPPNAGLLGHLTSRIFSAFLFPVKGSKPDGRDIESVIGRVESSLSRGELDSAVEEVANLKGWPRRLANDWLVEGRKSLEIKFLIDLISTEAIIL
ncbi:uncharacterized protein PRCAT00005849001 [Priceomyces carsonii]|uniref:uncharacterized protein n=1 Tax=Priceomyces carsonii TaxID=28549 RepID=UPI002EDAB536|nr:unnamed protein product [Priceomyces carsonii]